MIKNKKGRREVLQELIAVETKKDTIDKDKLDELVKELSELEEKPRASEYLEYTNKKSKSL